TVIARHIAPAGRAALAAGPLCSVVGCRLRALTRAVELLATRAAVAKATRQRGSQRFIARLAGRTESYALERGSRLVAGLLVRRLRGSSRYWSVMLPSIRLPLLL